MYHRYVAIRCHSADLSYNRLSLIDNVIVNKNISMDEIAYSSMKSISSQQYRYQQTKSITPNWYKVTFNVLQYCGIDVTAVNKCGTD